MDSDSPASSVPRIAVKADRKAVKSEFRDVAALPYSAERLARLEQLIIAHGHADAELNVAFLREMGRTCMWLNKFRLAAKSFYYAAHLDAHYFYPDAGLLNDYAASLMMLDDPTAWYAARAALYQASMIANTDVVMRNIAVVNTLIQRAEVVRVVMRGLSK